MRQANHTVIKKLYIICIYIAYRIIFRSNPLPTSLRAAAKAIKIKHHGKIKRIAREGKGMTGESEGKGIPGDRAFTSFSPSRIAFPWCSSYISSADNTIRRQDKTHPPSSWKMMVGCVVLPCIIA